jgi:tetratricopeptide (TPR) repeat protein
VKKTIPLFALALAVFVVYLPALGNGWVWDDTALILRDPFIRSWRLIPEGFQHFLFTDATASDFYRPIQRLTYTLEYWAFVVRPAPYHLTNVVCHIAAAIALFLCANELLRRFRVEDRLRNTVAFVAALAWAIHPIHNAAVAYVSGRADPLAATFGFLGLHFALKSDEAAGRKIWFYTTAAAALFVCSALSKEMGLIYPALWGAVLLIEKNWRAWLRWSAAGLCVAVIYLSLRLPAEHIPAPRIHSPPPPLVRPIIISRAFVEYAGLLVLPLKLQVERDVETHPTGANPDTATRAAWLELETLAGVALIAAAVYWALRVRKYDRAVFTLLMLAAIAYLPVSGIFALNAAMAEHWIYLPSAFLLLAAALALARHAATRQFVRTAIFVVLPVWLLFLGMRTFIRAFDWKDQRTFFERTIASGGDSARMLIDLAGVEINDGKLDAAKKHLTEALRKEPNHPFALLSLASVALRQQDYKAAHEILDRAAKIPLVEPQAHELRAILANKERGEVDLLRMRLASRTGPPNWEIEKRYVRLLAESNMLPAAIKELQSTLKTEWYRAESWQLMGELWEKAGNKAAAVVAFANANDYDVHLAQRPKILAR